MTWRHWIGVMIALVIIAIIGACANMNADAQEAFPRPPDDVYQAGVAMNEASGVWFLYTSPRRVLRDICNQRVGCHRLQGDFCLIVLERELPTLIEEVAVRSLLGQCTGWEP